MNKLQKEFENTGYIAWINADIYPDGRIYTKEYTEWLEKKVEALSLGIVGKRIFIVFAQRKDPLNEAREIVKVFNKESEAVIWIADNNPKKYYYEVHKVG